MDTRWLLAGVAPSQQPAPTVTDSQRPPKRQLSAASPCAVGCSRQRRCRSSREISPRMASCRLTAYSGRLEDLAIANV